MAFASLKETIYAWFTKNPLGIEHGGTGAATPAEACVNLGVIQTEDSGWITLPLEDGVTAKTNGGFNTPQYRKINDHVIIQGSVTMTSSSNEAVIIGTLPTGYRPINTVHKLIPCGGSRIARMYIDNSGNIKLEWIKNLVDGESVAVEQWFTINVDYYI